MTTAPTLLWFKDIRKDDIPQVGGKGANLGEMLSSGFPVPNGFCITAQAYFRVIDHNSLRPKIKEILQSIDVNNPDQLQAVAKRVQQVVAKVDIEDDMVSEIVTAYDKLSGNLHDALVAVRSSATAEDLPDASFAGQQETFLNIKGEANLIEHIRLAWASLFTARAIFYREQKKFDHFQVGIAVPVQKMVQSDVSGVMFTVDPVSQDKTVIVIEAVWGLGELIVQGSVTPDHYLVDKETLNIIQKTVAQQDVMMTKKGAVTKTIPVPSGMKTKIKLSENDIQSLAELGKKLHQHYFFPQDIEWALENGHLFIVQTRPITTLDKKATTIHDFKPQSKVSLNLPLIIQGDSASPGIGCGPAKIVKSPKEINKVQSGDVLVAPMTSPDYVPAMKKASAIVTDKGGQTSHAAIVSRELGIPAVVGTGEATKKITNNMVVTVNGTSGEVFKGAAEKSVLEQVKQEIPRMVSPEGDLFRTATKIYVNLAEPDRAPEIGRQRVDGVGLLRAEFILAGIGTHPKKMIADGKKSQFISALAEGIEIFCRSFDPRPVVYRTTDFKTNEYRNLVGGKAYEPVEENPMLGYRGAYRYLTDPAVFEMELEAIKLVRNKSGFKNLWVMIPYVHTPKELLEVKKIIAGAGLSRSPSFKLWMMVEIPANVVLLEEFIAVGIDGVSIGSNDLAMLMLGVDRDNEEVAPALNPLDPAVLWALEKTIKTCHQHHITASICGQAPSIYPDLCEKLIQWGITSISVNPDAIDHTRQVVHFHEERLLHK